MIARLVIILLFVLSGSALRAAEVVSGTHVDWFYQVIPFGRPSNQMATIYQNAEGSDPTCALFNYDGDSIAGISTCVDEGSAWYVVQPGQPFGRQTIDDGLFAPLLTFGGQRDYPAVDLEDGQDIYLGINTGTELDVEGWDVFGWVRLRPEDGNRLTIVDSVMSYDSPGIIVGTTTLIPEPAATTLVVLGMLLVARWRRVGPACHRRRRPGCPAGMMVGALRGAGLRLPPRMSSGQADRLFR